MSLLLALDSQLQYKGVEQESFDLRSLTKEDLNLRVNDMFSNNEDSENNKGSICPCCKHQISRKL